MITWNNLDTVKAYEALKKVDKVKLAEVMSGENGAARVKKYSVPMAEGLAYNYAAKQVDDEVLAMLADLARCFPFTDENLILAHIHNLSLKMVFLRKCFFYHKDSASFLSKLKLSCAALSLARVRPRG